MKYSYPKSEKLKSQKIIDSLFTQGKSVAKFPLRMVYRPLNPDESDQAFIGVSVSKKYFKKAVDRNYYKRLLRESYRLNQQLLKEKLQTPMAIMLFYQTNQPMSLEEMQHKMRLLFEKFHTNNSEQ